MHKVTLFLLTNCAERLDEEQGILAFLEIMNPAYKILMFLSANSLIQSLTHFILSYFFQTNVASILFYNKLSIKIDYILIKNSLVKK